MEAEGSSSNQHKRESFEEEESGWGWLPLELVENIMVEVALEARSLSAARAVCKEWLLLIDQRDQLLWRALAVRLFGAPYCRFLGPLVGPSANATLSASAGLACLYASWRELCAAEAILCRVKSTNFRVVRTISTKDSCDNLLVYKLKEKDRIMMLKMCSFISVEAMRDYKRFITKLHAMQSARFLQVIHPWIKPLAEQNRVRTVVERITGALICTKHCRFSVQQTAFYVAQLFLTLQCLREANLPFPSFQPEHILLGDDGYLRLDCHWTFLLLCDFDKKTTQRYMRGVEYTPPEALAEWRYWRRPPTYEECLWMVGCVAFRMLVGASPFGDSDRSRYSLSRLFMTIQHVPPPWPPFWSSLPLSCRGLVETLLDKDPEKRKRRLTLDEYREHSFFKENGFADAASWALLAQNAMPAPFKPSMW
ncbi:Serine/threonine-protein kinase [Balamuthia mandrillaris]